MVADTAKGHMENLYLTRVKGAEDDWSAELIVDEDDPFYFDHPLDHIPGMLLLTGVLELIRAAEGEDVTAAARRVSMSVTFRSFAELNIATEMRATQSAFSDQGMQWSVGVEQNHGSVLDGWLNVREDEALTRSRSSSPAAQPVPAELVHKRRPENVLIGLPRSDGAGETTPLLPLPADHQLVRRSPEFRTVEELTEAARQFIVYNSHTVDGMSLETQMILSRISFQLPRVLPRDWPVSMRKVLGSSNGVRRSLLFELIGDPEDEPYGRFLVSGRASSAASYARLRRLGVSA
jgi:hypothetical protein